VHKRYNYQLALTRGRSRFEWASAYVAQALSNIPFGIVADIRRYTEYQRGRGTRESSVANTIFALRDLALSAQVSSAQELTPELLRAALQQYAKGRSPWSVVAYAKQVRAFVNWVHEGETPASLRRALLYKSPKRPVERRPLTQEEFDAMLRAARGADNIYADRDVAMLWILWDSGMRMSEVLALRRKSILPQDDGGMILSLPRDAPHLKTGPRDVYVLECVPYVEAWLKTARNKDADAPLFPQSRDTTRTLFLTYTARILADLSTRAGIRHVHPHLFRHTRATRAAEAGWNEFEMNAYFGWTGSAKMAGRYVHLRDLHLRERVLRDRDLVEGPGLTAAESIDDLIAELARILQGDSDIQEGD